MIGDDAGGRGADMMDAQPGQHPDQAPRFCRFDAREQVVGLLFTHSLKLKNGVVQDKLFLPGLRKIKLLKDSGFFGRIFAVRGEFGYWVFEGDWGVAAQRPSWNYRKAEGGGILAAALLLGSPLPLTMEFSQKSHR